MATLRATDQGTAYSIGALLADAIMAGLAGNHRGELAALLLSDRRMADVERSARQARARAIFDAAFAHRDDLLRARGYACDEGVWRRAVSHGAAAN